MIDVVLDTMIYVRGDMNPLGRWGRLLDEEADTYHPVVSLPILREILDAITRPEIVRKYRGQADRDIKRVLAVLAATDMVEPAAIGGICRDPKDDVFIATAVAANAAFLVSEDRDLLDIGEYAGVRIVDAETFLGLLA